MHILGPLDLDAHRLYIRPQAGEEQQQRRPVVHPELLAAAPQYHKGLPDGHEPQENAPQQNELQPSHLGKQRVQRPHGRVLRHQPVYSWRHHVGDGVAEQQEIVVQLGGDDIHRHRPRAVKPRQQLPVNAPVQVIHHDADEHIHREPKHLPQQREVIPPEREGHFQLFQAVKDVDNAADHRKNQRHDGQHHGPVAHQQQRDHDQRVQHLLSHSHDLLEQILLVDGHVALEHADRERQCRVDGQDAQQPLRQIDLLRRQLLAEDHIAV